MVYSLQFLILSYDIDIKFSGCKGMDYLQNKR